MDVNLVTYMNNQLKATDTDFHRYMYDRIDWRGRMFGLVGPRGVGKTTLFLQYIKEHIDDERMFYVSADNIYFSGHSLVELADEFYREGGQYLFIDEVHKYSNWSQELKQIYDTHPDLRIAFTGSSVLDINKGEADLSRRAPIYMMQGLSFREYLILFRHLDAPLLSLDQIVGGMTKMDWINHPLPYFKEYLRRGYYPFSGDSQFEIELSQIINLTMEVDIPLFAGMNTSTGRKLKRLLAIVAKSVPFKPVMDKIAKLINVSRNDLGDYLMYMEKAGMLSQLRDETGGIMGLGKVDKVYIDNTNIAYILGEQAADIGNIRETFFFNQMRVNNNVVSSKISDFNINGRIFEVGGKNKGQRQIVEASEGYVVKDDIEFASGNVIPLWQFGLNY